MSGRAHPESMRLLMANTETAYMRGMHYSERAWSQVGRYLLEGGYSLAEAIEVMRSKHMRWASDSVSGGAMTLPKFRAYFERHSTKRDVAQMLIDCGHRRPVPTSRQAKLGQAAIGALEVAFEDHESATTLLGEDDALGLANAAPVSGRTKPTFLVAFADHERYEIEVHVRRVI